MSLPSDVSHPKQGLLPKEADFKNDGIDVHFSQLKLDDKGQYKNVLSCVIARKQIRFKIALVPI